MSKYDINDFLHEEIEDFWDQAERLECRFTRILNMLKGDHRKYFMELYIYANESLVKALKEFSFEEKSDQHRNKNEH